ncbi:MAG TPA: ferritin-like domain-containing protein [Vicinamibacteria bacterium]|nr:ferritin-like domain-containing protein [Vicinamibacteria bacterium]
MLLSRGEMSFDFEGARFDIDRDRELLAWTFSQFLYGEVTGIQVGHWLYRAPSLDAANFLARQAVEELQHVDKFRDILRILSRPPGPPHRAVRFLSTGMMGDDWAEHVCLEMALGEGYVLTVLYALLDTIEHDGIHAILTRATRQEERHVAFGEEETSRLVRSSSAVRKRLFGLSLWSLLGVDLLEKAVARRSYEGHPVLGRLPEFVRHLRGAAELRLSRLGILDRPLSELGPSGRLGAMLASGAGHVARRVWPRRRAKLTKTYLSDTRLSVGATTSGC